MLVVRSEARGLLEGMRYGMSSTLQSGTTKKRPSRSEGKKGWKLPPLKPDLYINRELSWLEFNRRVLEEMRRTSTPLLERVKFAAIFSSNLDEFFMIRVAGAKRKVVAGITDRGPDGRTPVQAHRAIHNLAQELLTQQVVSVTAELFPALKGAGIEIVNYDELKRSERDALGHVFEREVFPVLTPQAVDRGRRFPHVSNDSVNLIVVLKSKGESRFARVKVPALLPRFVPVPASSPEGESGKVLVGGLKDVKHEMMRFTLLEQVIAAHMDRLFPGSEVVASYAFHLLRDSDVEPDEEDDDRQDLLEIMRETLSQRPFGTVVRIDIDESMPKPVRRWLMDQVHAGEDELYVVDGPLGLDDLFELSRIDRPDLKDPSFVPATHFPWKDADGRHEPQDVFNAVRENDILLHLPYQSFSGVVDFVRAASQEADVVAIKQTLYRVGRDSPLIPALIEARDDDTQVAVLVELKARFDEENNISWAQTLETHGVHVAYGLSGLKTHCKLTMVVRREADGLRRYCHIATGNYNANTARTYEDIGILTCRENIAADVTNLFNVLTGYAERVRYETLWVAPEFIREKLIDAIRIETESHRVHGNGHIVLKMNSLVDRETIRALYAASREGVKIDLIIRGICCLRPGVPGWSETIRVVSVVGRFLEHSRIFYFENIGHPKLYIGSADAMERNFDRRVEVIAPVESPELIEHLRHKVLGSYLKDTVNARCLQSDGSWVRVEPETGSGPFDVQRWFLDQYKSMSPVGSPK
jgi:polyphosphate kinase